jgi:hypothetical protein
MNLNPKTLRSLAASTILGSALVAGLTLYAHAAHQDPTPPVVDPGPVGGPPADAVVVFDGKSFNGLHGEGHEDVKWKLGNGYMEVTDTGGLFSKQEFGDCQIHVEWAEPADAKGEGQGRGNSGVYLMGRWEIQVLDSYNNPTYANGQCGALYARNAPLVNSSRKPGEWQSYDMVFHWPKKGSDGQVHDGSVTILQNGVLIQDHIPVSAEPTPGSPLNGLADKGPIYLQDHGGDKVRFRNIWVRPL